MPCQLSWLYPVKFEGILNLVFSEEGGFWTGRARSGDFFRVFDICWYVFLSHNFFYILAGIPQSFNYFNVNQVFQVIFSAALFYALKPNTLRWKLMLHALNNPMDRINQVSNKDKFFMSCVCFGFLSFIRFSFDLNFFFVSKCE